MSFFPTIQELRKRPVPARGRVLDARGRERAANLYPSPSANAKAYQRRPTPSADTQTNVSAYDRADLVKYSRLIYATVDNVSTAVEQKNSWAFASYAWDPEFSGTNAVWGERAQDWLKNVFYPNANVRGGPYDFKTSLAVSGRAWDVDGDDLMLLVRGSLPQLAFYPATRIGGRIIHSGTQVITSGRYSGSRLFDGIVLDRNNRMIAVAVRKDQTPENTWGAASIEDTVFVPASGCELAFEPKWADQGRGIPRIATTLLRQMSLQDIDDFLIKGVKRAAVHQLQEFTEDGQPKDATLMDEEGTSILDTPPDTSEHSYYQELDGGEVRVYKAGTGEKMESLTFENPHQNVEAFIQRIERGSMLSLGWFYELLNLGESGRAATRLVCDLANQSIWDRQYTGTRRAHRAVNFALATAMENGLLPRNTDGGGLDAFQWDFGSPKEISVDAGNDQKAAIDRLRMKMTARTIEAQRMGYRQKELDKLRQSERIADIDAAAELVEHAKQAGHDLPFLAALDMQEMDIANGRQAPPAPAEKTAVEIQDSPDDQDEDDAPTPAKKP